MNKYIISLIIISILAAGLQTYYTFSEPTFNQDSSYLHLRQAEHIIQNHEALRYDRLSYGGRTFYGSAFYWYFIAGFLGIFGIYALKIIPPLIFLVLPLLIYLITYHFLKEEKYAWLAAVSSAWIPIMWKELTNSLDLLLIFIPLAILLFYTYLEADNNQKHLLPLIIMTFLLGIITPYSLIIAVTLLVWHILMYIENFTPEPIRGEATFLFVLFTFFFQFYLYRTLITTLGPEIIYQGAPKTLLNNYLSSINLFVLIGGIGILSIIFGAYGIYTTLKKPNEPFTLVTAFIFTIILLLFAKLIPFIPGMILLSIGMVLMASTGYEQFFRYISLTKFSKLTTPAFIVLIVLIGLTLTLPSIISGYGTRENTPTASEIELFTFIKESTPKNSIILTGINEGNILTYYSERKNLMDNNYIGAPDSNRRYDALNQLYSTESNIKAQELVEEYDIDYIYLSPRTQDEHNIDILPYTQDNPCFTIIKDTPEGGKLYEYTC